MSDQLRCLIVGLGQIGMGYDYDVQGEAQVYTHARAISLHPAFALAGGVDPSDQQRVRFEAKYSALAFADLGRAMQEVRPDCVIIATPPELHRAHVEMILDAHTPRVLVCEKPLALTQADGEAIVALCEAAGVALFVNYIRRSEPGALEVLRLLEAGQIATPLKGAFWYSKGLLNNGGHIINLLELWLGALSGYTLVEKGRRWITDDPEPDVHLRFARGSVALSAAWEEAYSFCGGELVSPSGRLVYAEGGEAISWQGTVPHEKFADYTRLSGDRQTIHNDMDRYQWHVYEQLARFLAGDSYHLCTGRQALTTLNIVTAIAAAHEDD